MTIPAAATTATDDLAARPTTEVDVPDRPAIPGLRFRTWAGLADLPGMAAANQAVRDATGRLEVVTAERMANGYRHLTNSDPERDILIVERDREVVGYSRCEWRDQTDGRRVFETFCILRPDQRRLGIGRAMLGWGERRLAEVARALPADRPGRLGAWAIRGDPGTDALMAGAGWTVDHVAHELLRPDLEAIPDVPLPDGLEVRALTRADTGRLWDALVDGFRDHPEEPEASDEDAAEFAADPDQDPELWIVAFDADEIAGGVLNKVEPAPDGTPTTRGLLDAVFTRTPWRRRGLARALIARSLRVLRDRGLTDAYLGVDAANPNQAMTLYESLGFAVVASENHWTKPLPADAAGAGMEEQPT